MVFWRALVVSLLVLCTTGLLGQSVLPGKVCVKVTQEYAYDFENVGYALIRDALVVPFEITRAYPNTSASRSLPSALERSFTISFAPDIDPYLVIRKLLKLPAFEYVEPSYVGTLAITPNDPNLSNQNFIQQLQLPQVWDVATGQGIVIGLVDNGCDTNHEDLADRLHRISGEVVNGADSDGNGYIDDVLGYNLVSNNTDLTTGSNTHGTQMAGTMLATFNNGKGIAGIAPNAEFITVKVAEGSEVTHGYEGVVYAADQGVDIINCSWVMPFFSQKGKDAVDYAISKGAVVVAAAGNDGDFRTMYPAAFDGVLSVAGTDNLDQRMGNSNRHYSLDLGVPGLGIHTTINNNGYDYNSGTSLSAANMSGIVALMKETYPSRANEDLVHILKKTSFNHYTLSVNSSFVGQYGTGRVEPLSALQYSGGAFVEAVNIGASSARGASFMPGDTVDIDVTLSTELDNAAAVYVKTATGNGFINMMKDSTEVGPTALGQEVIVTSAFRFVVSQAIPENYEVFFPVWTVFDGDTSRSGIRLSFNTSFLAIETDHLKTVVTSDGRLGSITYPMLTSDVGLRYKNGVNLMYESGVMLGQKTNGNTLVMDRIRGIRNQQHEDWVNITSIERKNFVDREEVHTTFSDAGATPRIGVEITEIVKAYKGSSGADYFVIEYAVKNTSGKALTGLYLGQMADFDIDPFEKNHVKYDERRITNYTAQKTGVGTHVGWQLLNDENLVQFYGVDMVNGGNGGIDIMDNDVFSPEEKYTTLTERRWFAGEAAEGSDVFQVLSKGPFSIPKGAADTTRFALLVSSGEEAYLDLAESVFYSENQRTPADVEEEMITVNDVQLFPNPTFDVARIVSNETVLRVAVYSINGGVVYEKETSSKALDIKTSTWDAGMYLVHIETAEGTTVKKLVKKSFP